MELHQLVTFRAVARSLSFTQAAATLNYAQSTVSAQVQALEAELGVPLFDRLGKRITLTGAGQQLLAYTEKLLNLADEARAVVSGRDGPAGTLILSAPETLCTYRLPEALRRFRGQFPRVQLIVGYNVSADLSDQLGKGMADLAFIIGEEVRSPNLVVERLVAEPLVLVTEPGHALAGSRGVKPADLQHEPMLLTEAGCTYRVLFERAIAAAGLHLSTVLEFHSVESIKQSTIAGLGLACLPAITVTGELVRGQLIALPWAGPPLEVVTQMIWHKDKWLSPALAAFIAIVRDTLKTDKIELNREVRQTLPIYSV